MLRKISFRMLCIDLESGQTETILIEEEELRPVLGGSSLGAKLAWREFDQGLDALAPEASLYFLTGPLTGTRGPAVGRYVVCAKSPATGLWGESNCGGLFGAGLRAAGYDGLAIRGRSANPAYLVIGEGICALHDARHLWSSHDTYQAQEAIRLELPGTAARVATIGLAGEAKIPMASIICDHGRAAGRTGMGAVMGAKNLKAIAVMGNQAIPLARPALFAKLRSKANKALKDETFALAIRAAGTAGGADYFDYLGFMPKRYFTRGYFEGLEHVTGTTMKETILSGISTCHGCVIACGRRVRLSDGIERKGPEYETLTGFGPNLEIGDLERITIMSEWCDRYGIDTISLSNTIGLAFLLFQEGIISTADTDGLELEWGEAHAAEILIHKAARKQGFGALIALGARGLAEHFGVPEMAVQVNGLEVAYHDPRGASGMALVYATSPRGACHNQSDFFMVDMGQSDPEVGVEFLGKSAGPEKARSVARHQDWRSLGSALVLCKFANVSAREVLQLVNAATGFDYELPELLAVGELAWTLKRAINHRMGLTAENDRIPDALLRPLADGPTAGYIPPFEQMLMAYYPARGWEPSTGRPTQEKLYQLGLGELADELW